MQERKELCVALTAAQESAMIQLLLEMCLPDSREEEEVYRITKNHAAAFHKKRFTKEGLTCATD